MPAASQEPRNRKSRQTPMAPEGASRCRAVTSGLMGPVGGQAVHVSCESGRNLWIGPTRAKKNGGNNGCASPLDAYRTMRVPLGSSTHHRRGPQMRSRPTLLAGFAACLACSFAQAQPQAPAQAQDYPNRPVTIVVPYAAGGGLDV